MDEPIQFSVGRTKETKDFFTAEISDTKKTRKTLNKYITALDYADKTFLILSGASSLNSFWSFTFIIGTPIGVVSASVSLVFLIRNGIAEMFLKTMGREKRFLY